MGQVRYEMPEQPFVTRLIGFTEDHLHFSPLFSFENRSIFDRQLTRFYQPSKSHIGIKQTILLCYYCIYYQANINNEG